MQTQFQGHSAATMDKMCLHRDLSEYKGVSVGLTFLNFGHRGMPVRSTCQATRNGSAIGKLLHDTMVAINGEG